MRACRVDQDRGEECHRRVEIEQRGDDDDQGSGAHEQHGAVGGNSGQRVAAPGEQPVFVATNPTRRRPATRTKAGQTCPAADSASAGARDGCGDRSRCASEGEQPAQRPRGGEVSHVLAHRARWTCFLGMTTRVTSVCGHVRSQQHRSIIVRRRSAPMADVLSEKARGTIAQPVLASLATINPDGSPQITPLWVDRDGDDVLFNTARGRKKARNLETRSECRGDCLRPERSVQRRRLPRHRDRCDRPTAPMPTSTCWPRSIWVSMSTRCVGRVKSASRCGWRTDHIATQGRPPAAGTALASSWPRKPGPGGSSRRSARIGAAPESLSVLVYRSVR